MSNELNYLLSRASKGLMSRREFVGRAGALGVSAAMASTLLATAARAEEPVKGGLLRIGMFGGESTNTLDPALAASQVPYMVSMSLGDMLVDVLPNGEIDHRIAEEISSSPDAVTWKLKIRQGVEFHNGKTLTADDVVQTLKRHTDEKSQSGALGIVQGIKEMAAEGDMVTLTLNAPNADLPFLLADYHLVMQPNGGYDNPADGIATGPYKIVVNEPGVRHGFEKFANYWDPNVGHVDQAEIIVINDNTARTSALQAGQVQIMNRVDPKIYELLKGAPGVKVQHVASRGHYVFIMHCDTAPFDNNDLRMALKLSVKRQEMVDKILGGLGTAGNDFPINIGYPLFDETIPQREFDAAAAAEHYKKSGHDGSPIVLQVAAGAFPGAIEAAQLFQQSAKEAGIPLEIKREPDDGYWSDVWNKAPFCASYWGGRPVQDQMYSTAYISTADWNDTRFKDPKFDETLIAARGELDPVKRKAEYSELAMNVRDNGGAIVPMFNDYVEAISDKIGGWIADPNGDLMGGKAMQKCWRTCAKRWV